MTQQEDITSQEPGAAQPAAGPGQPAAGPGQPAAGPGQPAAGPGQPAGGSAAGPVPAAGPAQAAGPVPAASTASAADAVQPAAAPQPVWPSPYLSEGAAIPEAYPAPPQPGQPRYGEPGGSVPAGAPLRPGQPGRPPPGYGEPGNGQAGYQPGYGQPGYGQPQPYARRPTGRLGTGGQVAGRDPALAAAWERLLAMTMDWFLILAVSFLAVLTPMLKFFRKLDAVLVNSQTVGHTVNQTAFNNLMRSPETGSTWLHFYLIAFAIALAYFWALTAVWGGTVGKHVLGLRVVMAGDRSRISVKAAGLRAVAFLVGPAIFLLLPDVFVLGGLIWIADCAVMLLDPRMQCLHDRAADTSVIRKQWLDQPARPTQASPW
jgi:uncharacterized RDD family membrane protein YckC